MTCYNLPMVMSSEEPITVSYPQPVMECIIKLITVPHIACEYVTEEHCNILPEIVEGAMMVEKCEVSLGNQFCQAMEVTIPKQVCIDLEQNTGLEKPS